MKAFLLAGAAVISVAAAAQTSMPATTATTTAVAYQAPVAIEK